MEAKDVTEKLLDAYQLANDTYITYYKNQPDSSVGEAYNAYQHKILEAKQQADDISDILQDKLKKAMAINEPKFDKAIQKMEEYQVKINNVVSDVGIAANCVKLIADVLAVFVTVA
ncbi:hypothetical protein [Acinetobacter seifertii]|uniref:hypothetical protein n=1 Tax=Acinetobacter seifertii TaxID=1530123 RepID=UPI00083BA430|nr:hypothetical protein [Acinetobacter seifertii]OCZ58291.1 hypothetical protein A7P21_04115 [Acinetobacter seifertii]